MTSGRLYTFCLYFRSALDAAQQCQDYIKVEGLPLEGCGHDIWLFEENMGVYKVVYEAELAGA